MDGFSSDGSTSFFNEDFENINDLESGLIPLIDAQELEWLAEFTVDFGVAATSGELAISQTGIHQEETSEGSYQTKPGGGRAKLTEAQRKINKRQSDYRYRQKQKRTVDELIVENKQLKLANELSNAKNKRLKELINSMQCNGQLPTAASAKQDINVPKLTSKQIEHQSDLVQDHHAANFGAAERPLGLEGNDLQNLTQNISITAAATNGSTAEVFMQKFLADDGSDVCFSDFPSLDGERVKVGKYSFPLCLRPIVERIIAVYGDVSATSKMNLLVTEPSYILFCASVQEMDHLQFEQVTEDRLLKWRDVIKDALRINFKVEFAMEHLKKIVHAYIGRIESQELESVSERISELEAQLNTRREELAKIKELVKKDMDAAEEFNGKSLSLFP